MGAVLIAYVVTRAGPRPLSLLAWGHAAVTVTVVVLTANHWGADALAGIGLLYVATLVAGAGARAPGSALTAARVASP